GLLVPFVDGSLRVAAKRDEGKDFPSDWGILVVVIAIGDATTTTAAAAGTAAALRRCVVGARALLAPREQVVIEKKRVPCGAIGMCRCREPTCLLRCNGRLCRDAAGYRKDRAGLFVPG